MKMKKLTGLLLAGIILSTGATTLASSPDVSAATVISENQYEKVMSFTKADLTAVTGIVLEPTEASIQRMYDSLKNERVWLALGYSSTEAQRITKRMAQSTYQAIGILTSMANNQNIQLKVVVINKPNYSTINIGTIGFVDKPTVPKDEPEKEDTNKPGDSALRSLVKEIEIEIEYQKEKIKLDYEVKSNGKIKAEVKNEQTGLKLQDAKAQTYVETLFVGLDAKTSSQEEIKTHIMEQLHANQKGLKKFAFKVKYADKTKVDFKIKYK
ncbi:MAG: YusW family protein [Enterococcus hirae]|nr:YusW family protein [Enterococcus hirae]